MSAAKKELQQFDIPQENSRQSKSSKVLSDINNLEKRLAELLEQESTGGSRISFGFAVLSCVARSEYDRALEELDSVGNGLEEYKFFELRARRFIEHAKSLVVAIRAKHSVGLSANVNKSKQKELSDKIAEHFIDLKRTIIVIEKIQKSVRSEDLSATVYFFKACFFSILAVVVYYAAYNLSGELEGMTFETMLNFFHWNLPF